MGYTHYWKVERDLTNEEWDDIRARATIWILREGAKVAGPLGDGEPLVDEKSIAFNGSGDDSHESFVFERHKTDFAFCKTARTPYDRAVVEVLKAIRNVAPESVTISSDGGDGVFE